MYYKAKNVDTDKALEAIEEARKYQRAKNDKEIAEKRAYLEGVEKGLDIAQSIFECSNYEKEERNMAFVKGADMQEIDKAIKILKEEYEKAQKLEFVRVKIAYALYQTWKFFDGGG